MKQVHFSCILLLLVVFPKADVLTVEVLNKIIGNTAISYLQKSNRVNSEAVKAISVTSVKLSDCLYNANVSISEVGCDIVFGFDIKIAKVKEGWNVNVVGETAYSREWRKKFLFSCRGQSELVILDSNDRDFPRWIDPDTSTVRMMFFNLLKQDFKLDSASLCNFKLAKQKICKKYVYLMNEKIFVSNGRLVSVGAKEVRGKISNGKKKTYSYGAILFFYKTPAGDWSADLLDQKIKVSITDEMDI